MDALDEVEVLVERLDLESLISTLSASDDLTLLWPPSLTPIVLLVANFELLPEDAFVADCDILVDDEPLDLLDCLVLAGALVLVRVVDEFLSREIILKEILSASTGLRKVRLNCAVTQLHQRAQPSGFIQLLSCAG